MKSLFLSLGLLAVAACGPADETPPMDPSLLLPGSEWGLADNQDTNTGRNTGTNTGTNTEQFIQFKVENQLNGFAGCNNFIGTYSIEDGNIKIGPLALTRKMCAVGMEEEQNFVKNLEAAHHVTVASNTSLTLFDETGEARLVLKRRDWD